MTILDHLPIIHRLLHFTWLTPTFDVEPKNQALVHLARLQHSCKHACGAKWKKQVNKS